MTRRPNPAPRASTRERARAATLRLLAEVDYGRLTYEGIAAASGVAKTSLYRHWPTKAELVFDLVLREQQLPSLAATGSPASDRAALADRFAVFVGSPVARRTFPGLVADISADPLLRQRFLDDFVVPARGLLGPVFTRMAPDSRLERMPTEDLQATLLGAAFIWVYLLALDTDDVRARLENLVDALLPSSP